MLYTLLTWHKCDWAQKGLCQAGGFSCDGGKVTGGCITVPILPLPAPIPSPLRLCLPSCGDREQHPMREAQTALWLSAQSKEEEQRHRCCRLLCMPKGSLGPGLSQTDKGREWPAQDGSHQCGSVLPQSGTCWSCPCLASLPLPLGFPVPHSGAVHINIQIEYYQGEAAWHFLLATTEVFMWSFPPKGRVTFLSEECLTELPSS